MVNLPANENILSLIQELNNQAEAEYAEPMYIRVLYDAQFTPNDAYLVNPGITQ